MKTIIICTAFATLMGLAGYSGKAQKSTNNVSADTLPYSLENVNNLSFTTVQSSLENINNESSDSLQSSLRNDTTSDNSIYLKESICDDPRGLIFWTSKKICKANPQLVLLLDTLYRYVPSDEKTEEELRWIRTYREQLCRYYDRNKLGSDTIPCYAKADTVLNHAERLWKTDIDGSTMGIIAYESTRYTWETFRQYNSMLQLWDICQNEKQRNLLLKEYKAWGKLEVAFKKLFGHCVDLCYWGGSIRGSIKSGVSNRLLRIRLRINNKEIARFNEYETGWENCGVFLSCAEELFMNCCSTAIKEYFYEEEESKYYHEVYNDAIQQVEKIKPLLKNWIKARNDWSQEVTGGGFSFDYYQRNTSEVLMALASIISSI